MQDDLRDISLRQVALIMTNVLCTGIVSSSVEFLRAWKWSWDELACHVCLACIKLGYRTLPPPLQKAGCGDSTSRLKRARVGKSRNGFEMTRHPDIGLNAHPLPADKPVRLSKFAFPTLTPAVRNDDLCVHFQLFLEIPRLCITSLSHT